MSSKAIGTIDTVATFFSSSTKETIEFIKQYEDQVQKGEVDTSKWGYVLQCGTEQSPPKEILDKVTQWTFV